MQIEHLIGVAALVSILVASFAGFGLAYLGYQPQIDSLNRTETSHTLEIQNLTSTCESLNANLSALEKNYTSLQSESTDMNATVNELIGVVANMSLVTSSSYYIFKQNNTYYAQNGLNGTIKCNNTSCSIVLDYTLSHIPFGGQVLLKPLASDTDAYYIDSAIYPPNGTTLASENRMVTLCLNNNTNVQNIVVLNDTHDVQIRDIEIDGNKWHNSNRNGTGIIIESDSSYMSDHVIENVVINECNGTGIWIQQYPTNNVVRNVQVFNSTVYNIEVDSSDNQLINVESGWADLSGFYVRGVDNYFLNCISWGCGQAVNSTDSNGFYIFGARNMFIGCDADRNARGGFVVADANQTMLTSCIGRNNGKSFTSCWGFDLSDSIGTIMSACVATDENTTLEYKTQDFGFTEGGNYSDYNIVTGCNFEGNKVGAVFDIIGIHSVITNTLGYETENFGLSNFNYYNITIPVGTNGIYGDTKNFTSSKGKIMDFHVTIKWEFHPASNENVTVKVQALMTNGTTTSFETSRNGTGVYILTEDDISGLWSSWSSNNQIEQLQISAKTTENATAAVSVFVWGSSN